MSQATALSLGDIVKLPDINEGVYEATLVEEWTIINELEITLTLNPEAFPPVPSPKSTAYHSTKFWEKGCTSWFKRVIDFERNC
ncbi:unnamed protein product [Lathyrus oleraceus]